jgi:hypothetical protein
MIAQGLCPGRPTNKFILVRNCIAAGCVSLLRAEQLSVREKLAFEVLVCYNTLSMTSYDEPYLYFLNAIVLLNSLLHSHRLALNTVAFSNMVTSSSVVW